MTLEFTQLAQTEPEHFAWISHSALLSIMTALEGAGGEAMYVGGCVRDSLLGHPPKPGDEATHTDIDIATTLEPDATIAALEGAGIKAVPTGIEHGTVTAVSQDIVAEITTLRADVDTDGRHAEVAFTTDWDEDWRRRDFTINAMYLTPDCRLYDPAGGREAVKNQEVIFIGDAETRLREDYLRILRFYRFSARYAAQMDAAGAAACRELAEGLSQISKERIGQEMMKILAGPRKAFVLEAMEADGILPAIMPCPADLSLVRPLSELPEIVAAEVMLAALWPEAETGTVSSAFRLSNAQSARLKAALEAARLIGPVPPHETGARQLLYHLGETAYCDGLLLARARAGDISPDEIEEWRAAFSLPANWTAPDFPLAAQDFLDAGVEKGPALGAALKKAGALWVAQDFPLDEISLEAILQEAVVQSSAG